MKTHRCPLGISSPAHYREDGSCLCMDADEISLKIVNRWKRGELDALRKAERRKAIERSPLV